MKLKYFENEEIPIEIHKFYDDLAEKYLKSDYKEGQEEEGPIKKEKIGRYLQSKDEITMVSQDIDFSYLLYCEEGYVKQDELVLNYDKYIRLKELKDIILKYSGLEFDASNIEHVDGKTIKDVKDFDSIIKVSDAGLLIAAHIFGIKKVKALFNKEKIYYHDSKAITTYIDDKDYDISFLLSFVKEKKVIPNISEDEKKDIEIDDSFIGQNEKSLKSQLEDVIKNKEVLEKLLGKNDKNDLISEIKKIFPNKDNENSVLVNDSPKIREKLKEKFDNEYGDDYTKYLEDTTNSKVLDEDKKPLNDILKSVDSENSDVINQENFNKFRKIGNNNRLRILDFLYNLCVYSSDPLEALEKALCFLSVKYENETKKEYVFNIAKRTIKEQVKKKITNKINEKLGIDLENDTNLFFTKLGLADVDDIRFDIRGMSFNSYFNTKEYRFLKIFKDNDEIKRSYTLNKNGKRIYKRARRLLDNLLIALIVSMTKLDTKNFDKVEDDRKNILRNFILFLDENENGLDYEDYKFFVSCDKPFNITSLFIGILKSKKDYKNLAIKQISYLMLDKSYDKYTKYEEDEAKIKKIFKTKNQFEYNMRLRDATNIYRFYKCLYKEEESKEKECFVCEGATLSCSNSSDLSTLIVSNSSKYIKGLKVATIYDNKITPFKTCMVNKKCCPSLNKWDKINNAMIDNKEALMNKAHTICKFGGIISIENPNQKDEVFYPILNKNEDLVYDIEDYVNIEKVYEFLENTYFKAPYKYMFNTYTNIMNIEKNCKNQMARILKPRIDEKNLVKDDVIPAVCNDIRSIVNVYPLALMIKGYYLAKRNDKKENSKYINIGKSLKNEKNFTNFITKAKKDLPILFNPYYVETKNLKKAYWMKKAMEEYQKRYSMQELRKRVCLYHKKGGGINAGINTPWCASFVNYILDNGFKSPSSQCFYQGDGKKYFDKINEGRYGAILVIKNPDGKGHCTFIVSENDKGYVCLGGNQSNRIKKSFYKKNNRIQGIYWPK